MAQIAMVYSSGNRGRDAWLPLLECIRAGVNHLGLKEVAFKLDVSGSSVSDALNERDRKRWAGEWITVVIDMLDERRGDEIAEALCDAICDALIAWTGIRRIVKQPRELSDAELRAAVADGRLVWNVDKVGGKR